MYVWKKTGMEEVERWEKKWKFRSLDFIITYFLNSYLMRFFFFFNIFDIVLKSWKISVWYPEFFTLGDKIIPWFDLVIHRKSWKRIAQIDVIFKISYMDILRRDEAWGKEKKKVRYLSMRETIKMLFWSTICHRYIYKTNFHIFSNFFY